MGRKAGVWEADSGGNWTPRWRCRAGSQQGCDMSQLGVAAVERTVSAKERSQEAAATTLLIEDMEQQVKRPRGG